MDGVKKMKIVVSIVSFNRKDLLEECLKGLVSEKYKNDVSIWVVDNDSKDGSADLVKEKFNMVHLIENQKNVGFARAHNQVINLIKGDFVILLNPDTTIPKGTLDEMVDFINSTPDWGIASCKLVYPDGSLQSNGGDLPFGLSLIAWLFNLESLGNLPNFHRVDEEYYKKVREVGWVGGTFMVLKRELINKIGGLDEKIFMYFEDTDYCYRAKKAGFKIMLNPKIAVEHISGASSKNPNLRQWTGEYRGLIYFYKKHFGVVPSSFVKVLSLVSIILRIVAFGLIGKWRISQTYFKVVQNII